MTEFELIARYFDRAGGPRGAATRLGIGDDCALLATTPGRTLAVSTDMLVAGRHFFADADAASVGWKTLAVNLSDLAAMGAQPVAFTLAVALPGVDEAWLAAFSSGLFECADAFGCELVGGDTTRGPLTLCVTVFGELPEGLALRRDAARVDDDVWVSGTLGAASFALSCEERRRAGASIVIAPEIAAALHRPVPRVALGVGLVGIAHAAIDVSDGLAQDLGHVLAASRCGAAVELGMLPIADALAGLGDDERRTRALTGGDDYELCFTAGASARASIEAIARSAGTRVTRIGRIDAGHGLRLVDGAGVERPPDFASIGFDHFA